eukprot:jgi/Ulvmu1/8899/UM049_0081.1
MLQSLGNYQDFRVWLTDHKLQALGGAWLTAVAGSFGVQMMFNTPMTLKVFQTRIYAQAFTLAALCGAAAITITDEESKDKDSDDIFKR